MITADLNKLPLLEGWSNEDPTIHCKVAFPLFAAAGTDSLAVVYFELEPGKALGVHTDSAEEIVLVLDGTVEATIGDEKGTLGKGQMGVIPAMVPHNVRSVGLQTARVVGFFASATVESTFAKAIAPAGITKGGTPPVPKGPTPITWAQVMQMMVQR